ncbi:MAG: thioesterase family protein [Dokdonella sp.]
MTDTNAAIPTSAGTVLIRVPIALRWRDLDAYNHVNNASFLTFLEEARLRWLEAECEGWHSDVAAPVPASVTTNYRRQLGWPTDIVVELYCQRLGNSSVTIAHRIVDANDADALYCDGCVVVVWINPQNGKSVVLPASVRAGCAPA